MEYELDMTGIKITEENAITYARLNLKKQYMHLTIEKISLQPETKTAKVIYDQRPFTPEELEKAKQNEEAGKKSQQGRGRNRP